MATEELVRLLAELARAVSPLQKAKVLARGWRAVSRLGASELRELASSAGFDGAQELLERLADGRGLDRRLVAELLRRVAQADSATVKHYADAIRDPQQRETLLQRGLEIVSSSDEGDPGAPVTPRADPATPTSPAVPSAIDETEAGVGAADAAGTAVASKTPAPAEVEQAAHTASGSAALRGWSEPPEAPRNEQQRGRRADPGRGGLLLRRIAEATSLIERFRILHADLELARALGADELQKLIRAFPSGWARRRALAALLRARIPRELERAGELIESLESPVARRWCARTLLRYWELHGGERSVITERFGLTQRASLPPSTRRASHGGA
jgi:hypothetical protein